MNMAGKVKINDRYIENKVTKGESIKLLIFHSSGGFIGGSEIYLRNLVHTAVNDGIDVSVCFGFNSVVPERYDQDLISYGAKIVNINFDPIFQFGIANFKSIWQWLGKINPNIVLFNRFANWDSYRNAIIVSLIRGYRVITVEHNDPPAWPKYPPRKHPPRNLHIRDILKKIRFKLVANQLDAIICMNQIAYHRYINEYGCQSDIVRLIYNGVDIKKFEFNVNSRNKWREKLGLVSKNIMVIAVGRHSREKGMDILLESVAMLPDAQQKKVTLVLVGNGSEHVALKQQAIRLKILAQIKFLGERSDIPQLLWASDLFVCPSRQESFGISIAEAMAASRCVIATRVGGISELMKDSGILIPPESPEALSKAILNMINNENLRDEFGRLAFQRVSTYFGLERSMQQTLDLIKYCTRCNR